MSPAADRPKDQTAQDLASATSAEVPPVVPTSPDGKNIDNSGLPDAQELAAIGAAWSQLPESIRVDVLALIQTAAGRPVQEPKR